ncbi:MAG TPA: OsmC family protein [Candidatus Xenobia bacterium]|nr:OsmC family protein [Candidatus Xenobia bacterium]
MTDKTAYRVSLSLIADYQFLVSFGDLPDDAPLIVDEAPPLGQGAGPSPAALLAAAATNCLAASLLFCLRKARARVAGLTADAVVRLGRNEAGRLRVTRIDVKLVPDVGADEAQLERCQGIFEEFCTVTESLRQGIPVGVSVEAAPAAGRAAAIPADSAAACRDAR